MKELNPLLWFWRPIGCHSLPRILCFIVCMSVLTLYYYYKTLVGIERLELSTFRVSGECSNQLSYIPMLYRWLDLNQRALRPKRCEIDRTRLHLYFVIGPGLEPKLNVPKTFVLPLHHPTIWAGDWVRTSNFVLGRNALYQLSYTRFCAFWELRYPGPIINSDVLYLWAKKAILVRVDGLEPPNSNENWFTVSCNCHYTILPK